MEENAATLVKDFFRSYRLQHFSAGQVLLSNGDAVRDVFYLTEGKVKMYDVTYRGDEVILNVFKPGAFFPMGAAFKPGEENKYVYEAETDVELHMAPLEEALAFLQQHPAVVFDLLGRLYSGLDGLLGRMSHLMSGGAKGRLLYELLIEARRFGKHEAAGRCVLSISEKELASRAGLTRETVSREMHKLKEIGLITVKPKNIVVNDLQIIERLLGEEV
jgi:CRP/FNR family transcriptional regulator